MRLPVYDGPTDLKKMDAKMFNRYIGLLYRNWNDADSGAAIWGQVAFNGEVVGVNTVTASYTLLPTDFLVLVNSATSTTMTLPSAVPKKGRAFIVMNINTGNVTINTTSAQTINGGTSTGLPGQYTHVQLFSDGSNWFAI